MKDRKNKKHRQQEIEAATNRELSTRCVDCGADDADFACDDCGEPLCRDCGEGVRHYGATVCAACEEERRQ